MGQYKQVIAAVELDPACDNVAVEKAESVVGIAQRVIRNPVALMDWITQPLFRK